jgi:hypothetical protein
MLTNVTFTFLVAVDLCMLLKCINETQRRTDWLAAFRTNRLHNATNGTALGCVSSSQITQRRHSWYSRLFILVLLWLVVARVASRCITMPSL